MKVKIVDCREAWTETGFGLKCPECGSKDVKMKFTDKLPNLGGYYVCEKGHAFALASHLVGDKLTNRIGGEIEI